MACRTGLLTTLHHCQQNAASQRHSWRPVNVVAVCPAHTLNHRTTPMSSDHFYASDVARGAMSARCPSVCACTHAHLCTCLQQAHTFPDHLAGSFQFFEVLIFCCCCFFKFVSCSMLLQWRCTSLTAIFQVNLAQSLASCHLNFLSLLFPFVMNVCILSWWTRT